MRSTPGTRGRKDKHRPYALVLGLLAAAAPSARTAGFRRVVCTQPRRILAISLARRVQFETLNVHGDEIAYKIRFASTMTGARGVRPAWRARCATCVRPA